MFSGFAAKFGSWRAPFACLTDLPLSSSAGVCPFSQFLWITPCVRIVVVPHNRKYSEDNENEVEQMNQVSKEIKQSIVERMMPPYNESVSRIARESGLSETTLYKWKNAAKAQGLNMPTNTLSTDRWNAQEKFAMVVETAALNETELSEYCRSKGLFVEQIEAWRNVCMNANGGITEQTSKLHAELRTKEQEVKALSRELQRKESALAETAALLVLRKKAHAIWGDLGDE